MNSEKIVQTLIDQKKTEMTFGSIVGFVLITLIFAGLLTVLFTVGNISEVANNWPRYRCNPFYMPFASSFGSDPVENFNFCINNIFGENAISIFQPLYGILGNFGSIIGDIINATMGLRMLFSNMLNGFQSIMKNMKGQIGLLTNQVRMTFIKMNNLMGRVFGTMYAVIFMGMSAMSAGQNMANNDLVQFLFEFCFDPDTSVPLASGLHLPISMISVGDVLLGVGDKPVRVLSKFEFDGSKTPMVAIGSKEHPIILSSKHIVEGKFASEHPTSRSVPSIKKLICLNVEGHLFKVGVYGDYHLVSDYDESSDPTVVFETQKYAEKVLNNRNESNKIESVRSCLDSVMNEYTLGIDKNAFVKMADGTFKQLKFVDLGDEVYGSGKVVGKVNEYSKFSVQSEGLVSMTPSQLIWNGSKYIRAGLAYSDKIVKESNVFVQLLTEKCGAFFVKKSICDSNELVVREYREVPDPVMEDLYAEDVLCD